MPTKKAGKTKAKDAGMATTWKGLVDKTTGDLRSVGTVFADDAAVRFDVVDLGSTQPDLGVNEWDPVVRALKPRAAAVLVDRLDDIEARFQANADFASVWGSLTAGQRTTIRRGLRAVLLLALGTRRLRNAAEPVEIDA